MRGCFFFDAGRAREDFEALFLPRDGRHADARVGCDGLLCVVGAGAGALAVLQAFRTWGCWQRLSRALTLNGARLVSMARMVGDGTDSSTLKEKLGGFRGGGDRRGGRADAEGHGVSLRPRLGRDLPRFCGPSEARRDGEARGFRQGSYAVVGSCPRASPDFRPKPLAGDSSPVTSLGARQARRPVGCEQRCAAKCAAATHGLARASLRRPSPRIRRRCLLTTNLRDRDARLPDELIPFKAEAAESFAHAEPAVIAR